ncbi:MAG: MFS transporter [Caldiserica bacterium]|nr:MFS transporter [Caldisericota bacterium]
MAAGVRPSSRPEGDGIGHGPLRGTRAFLLVWFGQLVSLVGSKLTGFGLGVWAFQTTGSVTRFALIMLFTALPGILLSPIAGALVDRWDRRRTMILADTGAGLCTLGIALLIVTGKLEVWHIYLLMAASSAFDAFQWPAYQAPIGLLVPKAQYGRASGMVQLAGATAQIVAPAAAGAMLGVIGLGGIIAVDFATFLFAVATLAAVRIPRPARATAPASEGSLPREALEGWRYIAARPGLLGLLLLFALANFTIGMVYVLFTPLVLSFSTSAALGTLLSLGGIGFLAGGLLMSAWGGPSRRIYGIYAAEALLGATLFLAGFPPSVLILGIAAFSVYFAIPIVNGCSQAIWLAKTPPELQGRVFATRRMISWSSLPLAYLLAGPLADRVFEPLMAEGGPLAGSLGRVIGVGPGRGIALLYVVLGVFILGVTLWAVIYPRLRRLELEIPDALPA